MTKRVLTLCACTKIAFIGADCTELRLVPRFLRTVFVAWVGVFATAAITLVVV